VLLNLERNSIEAMQRAATLQPQLTLSTTRSSNGVCLTIEDSGPGLDTEEVERMFDPFETSKPAGMGMGLWISRAIIQAHGGRLWCEPVPHGARSFLPAGRGPAGCLNAADAATVFVVDDDVRCAPRSAHRCGSMACRFAQLSSADEFA
jgi:signal transduction histidine kinase